MSYQFAGFLADTVLPEPEELPQDASWRRIETPFQGVGVLLPQFFGKSPESKDVQEWAISLGFDKATRWLFLTYDTWAGQTDFVYGLGLDGGASFGPVKEDDLGVADEAFIKLLAILGVEEQQVYELPFFERGFWDES